jgi:glycosyltransferase involved in cell wall biosynthesis
VRIAHLVISGDVAGGQMVALDLARAAKARGDDVLFLSPTRGEFTALVEREGMRVVPVDVSRAGRLGGAQRLARDLRRERLSILHTHTAISANILSRLAGRFARVPVVSHLHIENYLPPSPLKAAVLRTLDNTTARLAARVIAVSEGTKRALIDQGYPERLVEVVPNGIHLVSHDGNLSGRTTLGVPEGAPLVGEIARLCDVKGQRELIRALRELPGVHAVFAGEDLEAGGAYRRGLEREGEELGVADRIHFTGYRPAAEVLPALDVFVLPSWIEGMPIVALEAMAYGKPVVATPVGGTAEVVVDGETGALVPPRDPRALAAAIRPLLDDPALAKRLGAAGRARVEQRFSADAMTRRVLEIYDEVATR